MLHDLCGICPFIGKFQNARTNIKGIRVGNRPAFRDEFHRGSRIEALRDEDAGAHRHATVTSVGAVSVDPASFADRFERGLRTANQFADRDREEGTVDGTKPERGDGLVVVRIRFRSTREAHVDDESNPEFAQSVVIGK